MEKDFDFNELEEVLKRVRSEQQNKPADETPAEPEPLEPPKTMQQMQKEASEPEAEEQQEEASEPAPEQKEKKKPALPKVNIKMPKIKLNTKVLSANFKTRLVPAVKDFFKKELVKKALLAVVAVLVIIGLGFGGVKLYQYSQVAYLKPYIEKYNIDFPEGIREEFCDDYGKDQNVMGRIVIEDTGTDVLAGSEKDGVAAFAEKGSSVLTDQHVRSVALRDSGLEKYYATPEAYVNASQLITFKTLFDDEQYKVVAAYYANTNPKNDNGYVFPYNAYGTMTAKSFNSYIDRVNTRSLYRTGVPLNYGGYYLSISTPTSTEPDSRFVILCKRVEDKEHFEKTTSTTPNKRIRHTQKWYDEHKEKNPFWLAEKWYPEIYTDSSQKKTKQLTKEDFE